MGLWASGPGQPTPLGSHGCLCQRDVSAELAHGPPPQGGDYGHRGGSVGPPPWPPLTFILVSFTGKFSIFTDITSKFTDILGLDCM